VPLARWHPWHVPFRALGEQHIGCRECRSRRCPLEGQPCLSNIRDTDIINAVDALAGRQGAAA
jgi:hypothetical protein